MQEAAGDRLQEEHEPQIAQIITNVLPITVIGNMLGIPKLFVAGQRSAYPPSVIS